MSVAYTLKQIFEATEDCAMANGDHGVWEKGRGARLVRWRFAAFAIAREQGRHSTTHIGKCAGGYDHSSVIHGAATHRKRVENGDPLSIGFERQIMDALGGVEPEAVEELKKSGMTMAEKARFYRAFREERRQRKIEEARQKLQRIEADREHERRRNEVIEEINKLRSKGWSVGGLSKRYGWSPRAVAIVCGEWDMAA